MKKHKRMTINEISALYRARHGIMSNPYILPEETCILEELRAYEAVQAAESVLRGVVWDELFRAAAELCVEIGHGSTMAFQERLRISAKRSTKIMDQLHLAGVVGPPDGHHPRELLITDADLEVMFPGKGDQ